ncbi:MAG: hypothetical protein LC641_06045, partial [Spirochaeta sp.]|nr:hypothetical protein [Spirochaeta sp.]
VSTSGARYTARGGGDVKYKLLERYFLDQDDDRVVWMRIFTDEKKLMNGHGVYRDDVLVLLYPDEVNDIIDVEALKQELDFEFLPEWDKTRYLVHMGDETEGYAVHDTIDCRTGWDLSKEELETVIKRIHEVF